MGAGSAMMGAATARRNQVPCRFVCIWLHPFICYRKGGAGVLGYLVGRRDSKVADFLRNLLLDWMPPLTVLKNYSFRSNADSIGRKIQLLIKNHTALIYSTNMIF